MELSGANKIKKKNESSGKSGRGKKDEKQRS